MKIRVISRELEVTDAIEEYIEKKAERIAKHVSEDIEITVTIKHEGESIVSQFAVNSGKDTYRSSSENSDLYASIDKNIDILQRQIVKNKTKREKSLRDVPEVQESNDDAFEVENEIIKEETYMIKPMTEEDAKILLSEHNTNIFMPFINVDTNKVNVIFKLKDGKNYGILVPDA